MFDLLLTSYLTSYCKTYIVHRLPYRIFLLIMPREGTRTRHSIYREYNNKDYKISSLIKEALNSGFGIGEDLFKSIFRMKGLLLFPSYYTTFSTYDQILCFCWFPSNSCNRNNGEIKHFFLGNIDYHGI